jgi:hypothetical protein
MRTLKHLPVNEWPEADREAFRAAYEPGDVFDETAGPGAHLAEGTRTWIRFTYRRWLGFLKTLLPRLAGRLTTDVGIWPSSMDRGSERR